MVPEWSLSSTSLWLNLSSATPPARATQAPVRPRQFAAGTSRVGEVPVAAGSSRGYDGGEGLRLTTRTAATPGTVAVELVRTRAVFVPLGRVLPPQDHRLKPTNAQSAAEATRFTAAIRARVPIAGDCPRAAEVAPKSGVRTSLAPRRRRSSESASGSATVRFRVGWENCITWTAAPPAR